MSDILSAFNNRPWLVLMTGPGKVEDLKELIEPLRPHIRGIVASFHYPKDEGADYLESVKGFGEIIYVKYCQRHDFSRNAYLFCGPIQEGDICLSTDDLERPNVEFVQSVPAFWGNMKRLGVNMVSYYHKPLLYEYHESLRYVGSPHESLMRADGRGRNIDLSHQFSDEKEIRLNVRPQKRPADHWVSHYVSYYLHPWGSNAVLLGLDTYGDPAKLFPARDDLRLAFRQEIKRRGFPLTVEGVKQAFSGPLDDTLKSFINGEIVLNNFFRYAVLGDKTVVHSHNPADIKPV